jgi:hypothetical protein
VSKQARVWNVMTRTRGGTVSLMKQLTEDEARGLMQRLHRPLEAGNPWVLEVRVERERRNRQQRREAAVTGSAFVNWGGGVHHCSDGDLEQIECWGPPGKDLVVWPKPADWDERWAAAMVELDAWEAALPPVEPSRPLEATTVVR